MRLPKAELELEINNPATLVIDAWDTPATKYPLEKVGRAKITRTQLNKDIYLMEGVRGYGKYYVKKPIPVTSLKIGRETVMVDDPLQWYGMQDLARHCKGKVLIGGLGLGLILHALQGDYDTVFKYGASRLWVLRADALRIRPLNFTVLFLHSKLYMVA